MRCSYLKGAAITVCLLGSISAAADDGINLRRGPVAPKSLSTAQSSPGVEREEIPGFLFRGQLRLTAEQRRKIWQGIQQTNAEQQPVPRAFAAAVGQTAPRELTLASLPPSLQNMPGLEKHHQFVLLNTGVTLIVGEDRLVVAMIQPDEDRPNGAGTGRP